MVLRATLQDVRSADAAAADDWQPETVLKADVFGRVELGRYRGKPAILRDLGRARPWALPVAALLFWHELRTLKRCEGLASLPRLLGREGRRLYRSWIPGVPMHVARPEGDTAYFRSAKALLLRLHRRGIAHNDLAKEPNWLRRPDGSAALIDFQLATFHRRRGKLFRLLAYEDLRHLLKHKRRYCPEALTPREKRVLANKTLAVRGFMATGKPLYNLVTRGVFGWSDGEGSGDRLTRWGEPLRQRLCAHPAVREAAIAAYPKAGHGHGLYAFVVAGAPVTAAALRRWASEALGRGGAPELVQLVDDLPRGSDGRLRQDVLDLISRNLVADVAGVVGEDGALAAATKPIVDGRLNLTDRRLEPARPTA
ncbi:MAG TPA: serine/threonine protein kinase [Afifellaceae bacterium]|nr:serine/threonine protein kinase [Afifellaceae bacterium]